MTDHRLRVTGLRAEHHEEPLGIGEWRPRLSWRTVTDRPGWSQTAYEIRLTDGDREVRRAHRPSADSVLVPWPGEALCSRRRIGVAVRVWGPGDQGPSPWSETLTVEAGLLEPADWSARFVSPAWPEPTDRQVPPPVLRGRFRPRAPAVSARLYATAHGLYEAEINGVRVGDHVLAPGWTHSTERLRYQTHDVTGLLREGDNEIRVLLADGWFCGRLGFGGGRRNNYGDRLAALAQIEVRYADGTAQTFGSGPDWQAAHGPILSSGIYEGEEYDARREPSDWGAVEVVRYDPARLAAPDGPPVRRTATLDPVAAWTSPSGRTILDFGQNLVGRLRIRVDGAPGRTITLRHAEVLEDGELSLRPLREARATDTYTLRGSPGGEEWEPRFTFHGFRYAEITGWPGEPAPGDVQTGRSWPRPGGPAGRPGRASRRAAGRCPIRAGRHSAELLARTVATAAPGYRRILVRPRPGGGLSHARAAHDTPYGRAEVSWSRTGGELRVAVTVPPGTTALVDLPGGSEPVEVGSGTHHFRTELS